MEMNLEELLNNHLGKAMHLSAEIVEAVVPARQAAFKEEGMHSLARAEGMVAKLRFHVHAGREIVASLRRGTVRAMEFEESIARLDMAMCVAQAAIKHGWEFAEGGYVPRVWWAR